MHRLAIILLVLAALAAGGCRSDNAYYHPNKPETAWGDDLWLCTASAEVLAETGRLRTGSEEAEIQQCMQALGYVYGHEPVAQVGESMTAGYDMPSTEYSVMESAYHIQILAEQRRLYLMDTGVRGVYVKRVNLGEDGDWFRVMIGSYESVDGAQRLKDQLMSRYGLRNLVILRENDILAGY